MKRSIIILISALLFSGCPYKSNVHPDSNTPANTTETMTAEETTARDNKIEEISVPVPGTDLTCTVIPSELSYTDITAVISAASDTVQTITAAVSDNEFLYDPASPIRGVCFSDVNFDGYTDILITHGRYGAQGLTKFRCYLQDDERKTFTECPEYFDIANPKVDAESKVIRSSSRGSAVSRYYEIYNWENGTPNMLVSVIEKITEDGKFSYEISDPEYSPSEITADYYDSESAIEVIFSESP